MHMAMSELAMDGFNGIQGVINRSVETDNEHECGRLHIYINSFSPGQSGYDVT